MNTKEDLKKRIKELETQLKSERKEFEVLRNSYSWLNKTVNAYEGTIHLFNSPTKIDENLEHCMDIIMGAIPAEAGSILFIDEKTDELFFAAARGPKADRLKEFRLKPGVGIAGFVVKEKETLTVSDVSKEPKFYAEISESIGFDTKSLLAVPIIFQGESLGAIEIINKKGNDVFVEREVKFAKRFGRIVGNLVALGSYIKQLK